MDAPLLLWHGSGTGNNDAVLRTILKKGLHKGYANNAKNMQAAGVFLSTSKQWVVDYTNRLSDDAHLYRRDGKPFVVGTPFDPALPGWDLDYELSYRTALDFLQFHREDLPSFPPELLRVVVRKENLSAKYPSLAPEQRAEPVADWTLLKIVADDDRLDLKFRNNLNPSRQAVIGISWHNSEVTGVDPQTGSFANIMEQLVHYYRDRDNAAFNDFIVKETVATRTGGPHVSLKFTGEEHLPVNVAEVLVGDKWKPALLARKAN